MGNAKLTVRAIIILIIFIFSYTAAYAYSIYPSTLTTSTATNTPSANSITSSSFGGLLTPYENFIQSMNSVTTSAIKASTSLIPSDISTGSQNLWQEFDMWLYEETGYHVSTITTGISNGFGSAANWAYKEAQRL